MDLITGMTTFVRVVEAGSLSAAARQLRVSTAAVSRHVAALEAGLRTPLLARTTRRLAVTDAGRRYYERCLRVLREVEEAQALGRSEPAAPVRITMPVTVGFLSAGELMRSLLAREPGLRLDVRLEDRVLDLLLDDVDVALRVAARPPLSTEVVARRIARWPLVVVASPDYVRRHGEPRAPSALAGHEVISVLRGATHETWTLRDEAGTAATVRLPVRCACNAGHLAHALVLEGAGVAVFPDWFVAPDVAARRLRRLLPRWRTDPVEVHALYRAAHRGDPRVRLVVDHLRALYAALP